MPKKIFCFTLRFYARVYGNKKKENNKFQECFKNISRKYKKHIFKENKTIV